MSTAAEPGPSPGSSRADRPVEPQAAGRLGDFRSTAGASLERVIAAGVEAYDRSRMLPRLARATPAEIADGSTAMRRVLLARLVRALRSERNRGRSGHWSYDLNRHIGLSQACRAERAMLMPRQTKPAAAGPSRVKGEEE